MKSLIFRDGHTVFETQVLHSLSKVAKSNLPTGKSCHHICYAQDKRNCYLTLVLPNKKKEGFSQLRVTKKVS